jgi:hypothetical protein
VVEAYGGQVQYLTYLPDHSTTRLIQRTLRTLER